MDSVVASPAPSSTLRLDCPQSSLALGRLQHALTRVHGLWAAPNHHSPDLEVER